MKERRVCRRCVLPEAPPDITLDASGLCNVCIDSERATEGARPRLETEFTRLLNKLRGKGDYDCLVMCSGGKDSTSALYYAVRRYKLRPLAFTFDHGFETGEALDNVLRAVEALGVDFMTYRTHHMHDMFRRVLQSGSPAVICHLCSIWYMDLTYQVAARFRTPLIIAGWTRGQSDERVAPLRGAGGVSKAMSKGLGDTVSPEFRAMGKATAEFLESLKGDPKYSDFPRTMEEVQRRAKKRYKCTVLSPHWFLPIDAETYVETIKRELGWKETARSYPARSTNCALNYVSVASSMKHFGYTHYHVEMSKMIRQGLLTRDEALDALRTDFPPELLDEVLEPLGIKYPG